MAAASSLRRTLGSSSRPRTSLLGSSHPRASPSLLAAGSRRSASSFPKRRWRSFDNHENAGAIVRQRVGVRGCRRGLRSDADAVGTPREDAPPSFRHVASRFSFQQHRSSSSSSGRTTAPSRPPLPVQFLDAYDGRKFDPSTHQRNDVPFDPVDGRPPSPAAHAAPEDGRSWNCDQDGDELCLTTKRHDDDGSRSHSYHSKNWMDSQVERWRANSSDFDCPWTTSGANSPKTTGATKRVLWSDWTESMVRDPELSPILFRYDNLAGKSDDRGASRNGEEGRLLKSLYQYGLALVTGTPTRTDSLPSEVTSEATRSSQTVTDADAGAESAILRLASIVGYHPLRTLYGGGVWSTSSHSSFYNDDGDGEEGGGEGSCGAGASTADSAYGSTSLPLHTDMTYLSNPPGVQVFLMVQPATTPSPSSTSNDDGSIAPKGQSVYLDGFSAARTLLTENPEAFRLLSALPRRYRCVDDEEGWHLEATGPLIETALGGEDEWGPTRAIRHNDLDRLPDLPPYPAGDGAEDDGRHGDAFYDELREAHEAWDDVLRRDSMRLVIDLRPGDCVLVANQRCLHGRYAFETSEFPRVVMGCYVGMDELSSKWRKGGLRVI